MRPLTILSGTNSSGKSSFIQLMLLLKQTLEDDSIERVLNLKGRLYSIVEYLDILKNRNVANKLRVEFVFNKAELSSYNDFDGFSIYSAVENYDLHITIVFDEAKDGKIIVSVFEVTFDPKGEGQTITTKFENSESRFFLRTNRPLLVSDIGNRGEGSSILRRIHYSSFIPIEIEVENVLPKVEGFSSEPTITFVKEVPKLDGIRALLKNVFGNLNYVGSYRKEPQDSYPDNGQNITVGKNGENVAEVLCRIMDDNITFHKLLETEDGFNLTECKDTFLNAVKYWICERFRLCSDIYSKKEADSYVIYVTSLFGVTSTIKHVGFGVSQILPIIVEGLRIPSGQTLILEQPEVHLHPKVQSAITDFLISLIESKKNVVIETHSDHIITRLRRRIAEDESNKLDDKCLLTFVELAGDDIMFRNIPIDDFGVIELPYPQEFIENPDAELTAVLKAQMKKRIKRVVK
jgi:predicted ATPase